MKTPKLWRTVANDVIYRDVLCPGSHSAFRQLKSTPAVDRDTDALLFLVYGARQANCNTVSCKLTLVSQPPE